MELNLYREYRIKFYLNARHFIIINGTNGDIHPHTWELTVRIRITHQNFIEFRVFEEGIENYLSQYQNKVLNDVKPFDTILPTLENMTDEFTKEFYRIIKNIGGSLLQVEMSESPTRSYILNLRANEEFARDGDEENEEVVEAAVEAVLDSILDTRNPKDTMEQMRHLMN